MISIQVTRKKVPFIKDLSKNYSLYLLALPTILYVLLFCYIPMGGVIVAFQDFYFNKGIFNSPLVGLKNFDFFFNSGKAWLLTKNTIGYNLVFIAINTSLSVLIAIMVSEMSGKGIKRVIQSTMILPNFISWVVIGGFLFNILNYEYGILNTVLRTVGLEPINAYSEPEDWRFILPAVSVWQGVGFGSIVYLASIAGIDQEIYESAYLDGAGIYRRIWHITLPLLLPTVVILTLLSIGGILKGNFEMFFQLIGHNGQLMDTTDVIDTYVFRTLVTSSNAIGTAAASGLYQQVIGFFLVISVNFLVKKVAPSYELF